MSDSVIDAAATTAQADRDRGEATLGDSRRRSLPGARLFFMLVIIFGVLLCGFLIWQAWMTKKAHAADAEKKQEQTAMIGAPMHAMHTPDVTGDQPANAATAQAPITPVAAQATAEPAKASTAPTPEQILRNRRLGSALTAQSDTASNANAAAATPAAQTPPYYGAYPPPGAAANAQAQPQTMDDMLSPVRLHAASAGQVGRQDFLLLQGAMIPCVMVTRIDSGLPGMLSCDVTTDIYSANGHTVLLDRGSRVTGMYQKGLQQGQNRLFVVWSRAVTPQGVIINIDSPGADQLGASGFDGKVNNHFWKRFGSAILLSVIEDVGQYAIASQQSSNGGNTTVSFGNTSQASQNMASTALQNSINIPPTLTKRNGELISIYVARDLDFGSIYALKAKPAAR